MDKVLIFGLTTSLHNSSPLSEIVPFQIEVASMAQYLSLPTLSLENKIKTIIDHTNN